jgi:hypothetical protein
MCRENPLVVVKIAAFRRYSGTCISFSTRSLFAGVPNLYQMIGGR